MAVPGQMVLFSQGDGMGQPSRISVRVPKEPGGEPWVGGCFKVCSTQTVQVSAGGGAGGVPLVGAVAVAMRRARRCDTGAHQRNEAVGVFVPPQDRRWPGTSKRRLCSWTSTQSLVYSM